MGRLASGNITKRMDAKQVDMKSINGWQMVCDDDTINNNRINEKSNSKWHQRGAVVKLVAIGVALNKPNQLYGRVSSLAILLIRDADWHWKLKTSFSYTTAAFCSVEITVERGYCSIQWIQWGASSLVYVVAVATQTLKADIQNSQSVIIRLWWLGQPLVGLARLPLHTVR